MTIENNLDSLESELKRLEAFAGVSNEGARKIGQLLAKIDTKRYENLIARRWEDLQSGRVTLTVNDYYQFWTDLCIDNDVVFFRCASRIDPKLWGGSDMRLYERRQIDNVHAFSQKDEGKKQELTELVRQRLRAIELGLSNFERVFLVDEEQRKDPVTLQRLCETISRQIKGGIQVKIMCIMSNEIPTFRRPQDFGIAITEKGDKLVMYLEVNEHGQQGGGQVIFDEDVIARFEDCYEKIEQRSNVVQIDKPKDIEKVILRLPRIDISDIYGNRCMTCILDAEQKVESGQWEDERTPLKTWYQIVKCENEAIENVLLELRPHSVLEIGCGPGRVLLQVARLNEIKKLDIGTIEGYEQNPSICAEATRRTQKKIYSLLVGESKDGKFHSLERDHIDRFDLILAVSNLVGWQKDEEKWIKEVLRAGRCLFFTVYVSGCELERSRMYTTAGDIVRLNNSEGTQIELLVDAFYGEAHVTRAYTEERITEIIENVAKEMPLERYTISYVGKYMLGCLVEKRK